MGRFVARMGKAWPAAVACYVAVAGAFAPSAHAQQSDPPDRQGAFLGLYLGALSPVGDWKRHPFAGQTSGNLTYRDDLDLFSTGFGGSLELGWQPPVPFYIALQFGIANLATGEWEDLAEDLDTPISAHALMMSGDLLFTFIVLERAGFRAGLRCGVGAVTASGGETLTTPPVTYGYTFLGTTIDLRAGMELSYRLAEALDLTALVDVSFGPYGLEHPNRDRRDYVSFFAAIGPRFWLDDQEGGS